MPVFIGADRAKLCLRNLFIDARLGKDNCTAFSSDASWRQVAILLLLTGTSCSLTPFFYLMHGLVRPNFSMPNIVAVFVFRRYQFIFNCYCEHSEFM